MTSIVVVDRRPALWGALSAARRLRHLAPDVALDLQGNWKSATLARLSGARRRIGVGRAWRREPRSHVLLNEKVECSGPPHPAHLALKVIRVLAPDAPPLPPELVAAEEEMEREADALTAAGVPGGQPLRVLVMARPEDPRSWHVDAMLRETREHPGPSVWLAGPDEADMPGPDGVPILRHGRGELRRLVALGCHLARVGGEAIGPDRGTIHVLAACGLPTTALYGPQDPGRTAPPEARVLVSADGPDCVPCRQRHCTHPQGPVCMDFTTSGGRGLAPVSFGE